MTERCVCGADAVLGHRIVVPRVDPPRIRNAPWTTTEHYTYRPQRAYEVVLEDIYEQQTHPWCRLDACVGVYGAKVALWRENRDKELDRLNNEYLAEARAARIRP